MARSSTMLALLIGTLLLAAAATVDARELDGGNIVTADDTGRLWFVESRTGKATEIGRIEVPEDDPGELNPVMTDIAFDPVAGVIWGCTFELLYKLDLSDPSKSRCVGEHEAQGLNALVVAPDGKLLGMTTEGQLYEVDTKTGKGKLIGPLGGGFTSSGDLAFHGGQLYGTVAGDTVGDILIRIDRKRGTATRVAEFKEPGNIPVANVYGLVALRGKLYALSAAGRTYSCDPATATIKLIGQAEPVYWGATEFELAF